MNPSARRGRTTVALGTVLALGAACSGDLQGSDTPPVTSAPAGVPSIANPGSSVGDTGVPPQTTLGPGNMPTPGVGVGDPTVPGSATPTGVPDPTSPSATPSTGVADPAPIGGEDPYAIPASPPASTLVATPRVAR